jgi:hypothetical protein
MTLSISDWIGISGVIATIVAALIAWFVSAWSTRKSLATQTLGYRMSLAPLLAMDRVPGGKSSLKIEFNGEQLVEPMLLSVDILNLGNRAIELPPIVIEAVGATYVIPIYIEDAPLGYEDLWKLERTDAEQCAIRLDHINPGHVVKARFFLDEVPKQMPVFKCPMKDVKVTEVKSLEVGPLASALLEVLSPVTYSAVKVLLR